MHATSPKTIDFEGLRRSIDLASIIAAALGPAVKVAGGSAWWRCPFHDDGNASLNTFANGTRWGCFSCGAKGDAADFLSRYEGITLAEAARRLTGDSPNGPAVRRRPAVEDRTGGRPEASERKPPAWENPAWQSAVDRIICDAERRLWSPAGKSALAWLRRRGLADHAIQAHRLGYVNSWVKSEPIDGLLDAKDRPSPVKVPPGITLPWVRPGSWYSATPCKDGEPGPRWCGLNVRRLSANPADPLPADISKTLCVRGSIRGELYPHADLMPGVPTLVCEGEFDALVALQEVGHVVSVVTAGGTSSFPTTDALAALESTGQWLLAFDADNAGDTALQAWHRRFPGRVSAMIVPGTDLNAYHQAGGSLRVWLRSEFDRLGLPWPLRS